VAPALEGSGWRDCGQLLGGAMLWGGICDNATVCCRVGRKLRWTGCE
jgi:hypothetical protein